MPLRAHVGDQLSHIGKGRLVDRERAVAVLIVDVEPDHVEWEMLLAEATSDGVRASASLM